MFELYFHLMNTEYISEVHMKHSQQTLLEVFVFVASMVLILELTQVMVLVQSIKN